MTDTTTTQIVAKASPLQDQLQAGIRQTILVVAAIASALGYNKLAGQASALLMVAGPLAGLITIVIGQIATRKASQKLAIVAAAAPDNVATIK